MTDLEWKRQYSVGHREFDNDHKILYIIFQRLKEINLKIKNLDQIEEEYISYSLNQLVQYTNQHFKDEENYMLKYDFPGYKNHKRSHDRLRKNLDKLVCRYQLEGPCVLLPLVDFLEIWWESHILNEDRRYAEYIDEGLYPDHSLCVEVG